MSRGDGDRSYEFRHELNFPGAARARQGTRGDPRAAARIAAVRIQGEPGFDQRELRRRLRLAEGDRFDFYRWQQDRDRLARFYHDRGYLEARIQATREADEGPDGRAGTTLVYAIERGPATVLDIQGARLPGEVLGQMRDTWARAVFDGFLLEDLEGLARRSLVAHGYVLAEARAAVDETVVDPKRILVRLSPGERYDEQRIEFRGQAQQTAAELDEVLRAGGLRPTVWLRPADVEAALVAHYRRRGHLSATVTIEEPSFSGRSATRVVRIVEGPQAQVVRVDVVGAQARPEAEVRRTFAITPGARYEPAELEPARREVELGYFRRGYNDARVSLVGLVDAEWAEVSLTLTIDEGRQQVLESVDVRGAGVTSRGTVDAALGLTAGMPGRAQRHRPRSEAPLRHRRVPARRGRAGAGARGHRHRTPAGPRHGHPGRGAGVPPAVRAPAQRRDGPDRGRPRDPSGRRPRPAPPQPVRPRHLGWHRGAGRGRPATGPRHPVDAAPVRPAGDIERVSDAVAGRFAADSRRAGDRRRLRLHDSSSGSGRGRRCWCPTTTGSPGSTCS